MCEAEAGPLLHAGSWARPDCFTCACASPQTLAALTRHSINLLPTHLAQALHVHSAPQEINERIESAIAWRSGDQLRREHITPFSLMFKDSGLEEKVAAGAGDRPAVPPPVLTSVLRWTPTPTLLLSMSKLKGPALGGWGLTSCFCANVG